MNDGAIKITQSFIVELEPGVWFADVTGDPGRTSRRTHAKRFATEKEAKAARTMARKYRAFREARIEEA